jgi:malonyl CoA-acyl carrier protein transacylase/NADP-dependent 3-hydroxy acid dehydrogenase YdfG/acyl carrier protein
MKWQGLFQGNYETVFLPKPITKTIRRAFIFPGQGSAVPGMFRENFSEIPEFGDVFATANQLASYFDLLPISNYISQPQSLPVDRIHIYRSCALFCSEVAVGFYLKRIGFSPEAMTGHSFGECAALVVSGILPFNEVMTVVIHRNLICPAPNSLGWMIAVSGEGAKVETLLGLPGVFLANRNSTKQIVVAVEASQKDSVLKHLRDSRTPHVFLNQLPQPYHSPLMKPSRDKIYSQIKGQDLKGRKPEVPVYSGVLHNWITEENFAVIDYAKILSEQITEPVDFIDQMTAIVKNGQDSFIEAGPGHMLESSIKNIVEGPIVYRDAEFVLNSLSSGRASQKVVVNEGLRESKWFARIRAMIQTVAGYREDQVDLGSSFQKDLGIDSIKKAEILFKIVTDGKISLGSDFSITRFGTIYEAVEYLENYSESHDPLRNRYEPEIKTFAIEYLPTPLYKFYQTSKLEQQTQLLRFKSFENDFAGLLEEVFHLKAEEPIICLEINDKYRFGRLEILEFHKVMQTHGGFKDKLHFQWILLDRSRNGCGRPLAAFLKSLQKETGAFAIKYIRTSDTDLTDEEIVQEGLSAAQVQIIPKDIWYKGGLRYQLEIVPFEIPTPPMEREKTILISVGGSRGIGLEILKQFPVREGDELFLLGRSLATEESVAKALAGLKSVWKNVRYAQVDARNTEALENLVSAAMKSFEGTSIFLNAAGSEVSKKFEERTTTDLDSEIGSKLEPALILNKLSQDPKCRRIVHLTSLVEYSGNRGQAVYSYANAAVSMASEENHKAVCIGYGPWDGVGMAGNIGMIQTLKEWGVSLMPIDLGAKIATSILVAEEFSKPRVVPVDEKDFFLTRLDRSHDVNYKKKTFGEFENLFDGVFYQELGFQHQPFLQDHLILGKPVVPASYFIAEYLLMGQFQFAKRVGLCNFAIPNLVMLENGYASLRTQAFHRNPYLIQTYSSVPHCTGRLEPHKVLSRKIFPLEEPVWEMDASSIYKDEIFNFGPLFQVLQKGSFDEKKQLCITVDSDKFGRYTGSLMFDFYISIFEIALQSISIQINVLIGAVTLPLEIEQILFQPETEITQVLHVVPKVESIEDKRSTLTLFFLNDKHEIFCECQGTQVRIHRFDEPKSVKLIKL